MRPRPSHIASTRIGMICQTGVISESDSEELSRALRASRIENLGSNDISLRTSDVPKFFELIHCSLRESRMAGAAWLEIMCITSLCPYSPLVDCL